MKSTNLLWKYYVQANELEFNHVDFQNKKKYYWCLDQIISDEEVIGTRAYAGFCDGIQGTRNRFEGARGFIKSEDYVPPDYQEQFDKGSAYRSKLLADQLEQNKLEA